MCSATLLSVRDLLMCTLPSPMYEHSTASLTNACGALHPVASVGIERKSVCVCVCVRVYVFVRMLLHLKLCIVSKAMRMVMLRSFCSGHRARMSLCTCKKAYKKTKNEASANVKQRTYIVQL